jgi:single-strand DNA-binding protein
MINRVTVLGNLTRDAELRETATGTSILKFGIAVNERVPNNNTGEWDDRPNYFDCVIFGKRAASLVQYLTKGQKVCVDGHLRWSSWDDNGSRRSKIEIVINELEFCGGRKQADTDVAAPAVVTEQTQAQPATTPTLYDEDIPF